jgi:hypothetical protein
VGACLGSLYLWENEYMRGVGYLVRLVICMGLMCTYVSGGAVRSSRIYSCNPMAKSRRVIVCRFGMCESLRAALLWN